VDWVRSYVNLLSVGDNRFHMHPELDWLWLRTLWIEISLARLVLSPWVRTSSNERFVSGLVPLDSTSYIVRHRSHMHRHYRRHSIFISCFSPPPSPSPSSVFSVLLEKKQNHGSCLTVSSNRAFSLAIISVIAVI
jgi:hypothetical protein